MLAGLDRVYALRTTFHIASVNLSLASLEIYASSCDAVSPSFKTVIDDLHTARIASVIAAGNAFSTSGLSMPACISTAVSVGSTTKSDLVSLFSNTASFLALLAPGSSIESSVPVSLSNPSGFVYMSGTSMAAPHVAGTWAVLKQRKPGASVREILDILQATGQPVMDSSDQTFRRIRVKAALDALPVAAHMAVDTPLAGTVSEPFTFTGWALDEGALSGTGVDVVQIWASPNPGSGAAAIFVGTATTGGARSDVAALFGDPFLHSGYTLPVRGLPSGAYQFVVYAHSSVTGTFDDAQTVTVVVHGDPQLAVDMPANGASVTGPFRVAGWAVDQAASAGTGVDAVHIWATPRAGGAAVFLGPATLGGVRPDVSAIFGTPFTNSGYDITASGLPAGTYDIVVYLHSAVTSQFAASQTVAVTVGNGDPQMSIDCPTSGATVTSPFSVGGWAIDRAASAGSGVDAVHVWAIPVGGGPAVFIGVAHIGGVRVDVGHIFGSHFANAAFDATASLAPGTYDLVVYAHSSATGTFNNARVVRITVQ